MTLFSCNTCTVILMHSVFLSFTLHIFFISPGIIIFSRLEWLAAMAMWRAAMWIPNHLFFRRRRRRFLPIFFFFFYFYYYKIMIMTIMIMKTIMSVFNLNQNAYPKRKCAYSFVRCWSFLLKPQSVAQGPVPRKMVLTTTKKFNQD